jgi:hypothetical protein
VSSNLDEESINIRVLVRNKADSTFVCFEVRTRSFSYQSFSIISSICRSYILQEESFYIPNKSQNYHPLASQKGPVQVKN